MDQLKKQLAVVLQYGFWIGCTIVLIGSVAVWYMSATELSNQSASQIGKIRADVGTVDSLREAMFNQPNETSHAEMLKMIDAREDEVLNAWSSIYQDQRRILTWPKTVELPDKFLDEFRHPKDPETGLFDKTRQKLPYEMFVSSPVEDSQKVPQFILRNYERYIGKVMPDIAKIAKTEWTADFNAASAYGGAGGMGEGMEEMDDGYGTGYATRADVNILGQKAGPLVQWSQNSQEAVLSDLFPWRGRRPTTLEVYYSQENLWILKQLLEIVAKVNGNARQSFEAKVREIKRLSIGKSARFGAGSLASPGAERATGMGGMDMEDMYGDMGETDMDSEMMGMDGGSTGISGGSDPADNRYVDTTLKPITGAELRGALASKSPDDANLAVAKRVPVMMSLQMDQRYVPKLLAECGSAPLMVEVRQVRVLPKGGTSGGGGGGSEYGGSEMEDMSMMEEDFGMEYGGGSAEPVSREIDEFPMDMNVEVYGLIYIYNPPDREALGVDKVTEDTEVDGTKIGDAAGTSTEDALPAPTTQPGPTTSPQTTPPGDAAPPAATPPVDAAPPADAAPPDATPPVALIRPSPLVPQ